MNTITSDTPNNIFNFVIDADMFNRQMFKINRPTSKAEVKEIISKSPNKSCYLDPLPI